MLSIKKIVFDIVTVYTYYLRQRFKNNGYSCIYSSCLFLVFDGSVGYAVRERSYVDSITLQTHVLKQGFIKNGYISY